MKFFAKFLAPIIMPVFICSGLQAQPGPEKKQGRCGTGRQDATIMAGEFKKGEMFFLWGYNRAIFSKSDIRFIGAGSDFKLHNVSAKDRPTPFNFYDYFLYPTIPQFVFNAGFFFKDNWCITMGTDHMKYVMVQNQEASLTGTIAANSETGSYAGSYKGQTIQLTEEFLKYEHTNGLNYIHAGLEHYHVLWAARNGPSKLVLVPGMSFSVLYPRSDVRLFGVPGSNIFHVAGWGTALHAGARFNLYKNLFVMWNNKGGFIALPDVVCELGKYKAKQHFFFYESSLSLGVNWRF